MRAVAVVAGVGLALVATAVVQAPASPASPAFTVERTVEVPAPGRVAVRLDRHVYDSSRADLADLRLRDGEDRLVPFVLDRGQPPGRAVDVVPVIRNRGWLADRSATAVLDFGDRAPKDRLRLELSGENFRRRVAVEGSDDAARWATLVEEAWVFAVPGAEPARYQTIELPPNDFRYLRLAVHPGPDERERVSLLGALLPAGGGRPLRDEPLVPRWTRAEDARSRETWLLLDLGARQQPFLSVSIDVADEHFFREAVVEARRDASRSGERAGGVRWDEIGRGVLHRLEHDGVRGESLTLAVRGREQWLRVRVKNADDRPLAIRGVSLRAPVERLLFEAAPGGRYRLVYGSPTAPPPDFDLPRTVGDVARWGATASAAGLGSPRRLDAQEAPPRPWTERHPALLWAGLVAVVAALGLLTAAALRRG